MKITTTIEISTAATIEISTADEKNTAVRATITYRPGRSGHNTEITTPAGTKSAAHKSLAEAIADAQRQIAGL